MARSPQSNSSSPPAPTKYQRTSPIEHEGIAERFVARRANPYGVERYVQIKRVRRKHPSFELGRMRLIDEARATARLCHPSIIAFLDIFEDAGGIYLLSAHVPGMTLSAVYAELRRLNTRLRPELVVYIMTELLKGLHHAHTARDEQGALLGLIHRDLRPSNIVLSNTGHPMLGGFSAVRMSERAQPKTEPGLVKGWTPYLAPEYIAGERYSQTVDVYACGVLLFELLLGAPCFEGEGTYEMMRRIIDEGPDLSRLESANVPVALQKVVRKATRFLPDQRYASAQEMADALQSWASSHPSGPRQLVGLLQRLRHAQKQAAVVKARLDSDPTELIPSNYQAA